MSDDELEAFRTEMGYEPLSSKDRKTLLQKYNAKIDFLSGLKKERHLPSPIGQVLKATHRYRNEAYHRDRIRKETIQPVVIVLFDIVTDLMLILTPGSMSYSSSDDWTEFCKRYGFEHPHQVFHDGIPAIVKALKEDMRPDVDTIAAALADHIKSRVDEMEDALNFLSRDSGAGFSPRRNFVVFSSGLSMTTCRIIETKYVLRVIVHRSPCRHSPSGARRGISYEMSQTNLNFFSVSRRLRQKLSLSKSAYMRLRVA